jgi:hypothetical protein
MISTVTTTTVTTVTTVALAGSLGLIAILALLALLVQKELVTAGESRFALVFGRVLNVGIIPLLMSFALMVFVKVAEALH